MLELLLVAQLQSDPVILIQPHGQIKQTFKQRHPRVYKCYRVARGACLVIKPFVEVAGAAAQVATAFGG